jgi:hypothetical protein
MKVYLDDAREAPQGWVRAYTPDEVIRLLKSGQVEQLSLDHDLGGDDTIGTGYTVLKWIEYEVAVNGFVPPPIIKVHSANPSVRLKMEQAIESIMRLARTSRKSTQ